MPIVKDHVVLQQSQHESTYVISAPLTTQNAEMISIDMMPMIDPTPRPVKSARRLTESEWMELDAPGLALACFELTRLTAAELEQLDSMHNADILRWLCSECSLARAMGIKKNSGGNTTALRREAARDARLHYAEIDLLSKRDMVAYLRWVRPRLVTNDLSGLVTGALQNAVHTARTLATHTNTAIKKLYITHIA